MPDLNKDVERGSEPTGYRGIQGCRTQEEALAAMEDELNYDDNGANTELKREVAILIRDFYDKINKYVKPPAFYRDMVYVRSIKKSVEVALQYKKEGEAFSHRLPSSAQMLVLRYTHQSGTLEEDICGVMVDYQIEYGAPMPFLGFGYSAAPLHNIIAAQLHDRESEDGQEEGRDEQEEDVSVHGGEEPDGVEVVDEVGEGNAVEEDIAEDDDNQTHPNFIQDDATFDQMEYNAWSLKRMIKLREDLKGFRASTAEITIAQQAEIDVLKSGNEEKKFLLSILQQQIQEFKKELQVLKSQRAVPALYPPLSRNFSSHCRTQEASDAGDREPPFSEAVQDGIYERVKTKEPQDDARY
ncbi:hypothetical protein ACHAQA_000585 [Verticillium albo-atrum]